MMLGEGDGRASEWVCWVEGIYDAKHVARVAVTPALRPRDHPEAGSTLGKDPGQPAQPAARFSKDPRELVFFFLSFCMESSLGLSEREERVSYMWQLELVSACGP